MKNSHAFTFAHSFEVLIRMYHLFAPHDLRLCLYIYRYKNGVPVNPLNAPGKYKIENKYGVHSLIISRYEFIGHLMFPSKNILNMKFGY